MICPGWRFISKFSLFFWSCTGMYWLCLHKLGHMLLYQGVRVAMYFFRTNAWAIIIHQLGGIKVFLQFSVCLIFPMESSSAVPLFHFFPHRFTHVPFNIWIWPGPRCKKEAQGVVSQSPPPPSHTRMLLRAPAKVRHQGLARSSVLWVCPGAHLAGPSSARLTQLIPVACARDSCQTVAAFWSLPAQDRFKLVSCWQPWISSLLLWMTFPLFCFNLELILLCRWYWYWLQQVLLNLESQGGWANQPHKF